jgi:hypothetical protein
MLSHAHFTSNSDLKFNREGLIGLFSGMGAPMGGGMMGAPMGAPMMSSPMMTPSFDTSPSIMGYGMPSLQQSFDYGMAHGAAFGNDFSAPATGGTASLNAPMSSSMLDTIGQISSDFGASLGANIHTSSLAEPIGSNTHFGTFNTGLSSYIDSFSMPTGGISEPSYIEPAGGMFSGGMNFDEMSPIFNDFGPQLGFHDTEMLSSGFDYFGQPSNLSAITNQWTSDFNIHTTGLIEPSIMHGGFESAFNDVDIGLMSNYLSNSFDLQTTGLIEPSIMHGGFESAFSDIDIGLMSNYLSNSFGLQTTGLIEPSIMHTGFESAFSDIDMGLMSNYLSNSFDLQTTGLIEPSIMHTGFESAFSDIDIGMVNNYLSNSFDIKTGGLSEPRRDDLDLIGRHILDTTPSFGSLDSGLDTWNSPVSYLDEDRNSLNFGLNDMTYKDAFFSPSENEFGLGLNKFEDNSFSTRFETKGLDNFLGGSLDLDPIKPLDLQYNDPLYSMSSLNQWEPLNPLEDKVGFGLDNFHSLKNNDLGFSLEFTQDQYVTPLLVEPFDPYTDPLNPIDNIYNLGQPDIGITNPYLDSFSPSTDMPLSFSTSYETNNLYGLHQENEFDLFQDSLNPNPVLDFQNTFMPELGLQSNSQFDLSTGLYSSPFEDFSVNLSDPLSLQPQVNYLDSTYSIGDEQSLYDPFFTQSSQLGSFGLSNGLNSQNLFSTNVEYEPSIFSPQISDSWDTFPTDFDVMGTSFDNSRFNLTNQKNSFMQTEPGIHDTFGFQDAILEDPLVSSRLERVYEMGLHKHFEHTGVPEANIPGMVDQSMETLSEYWNTFNVRFVPFSDFDIDSRKNEGYRSNFNNLSDKDAVVEHTKLKHQLRNNFLGREFSDIELRDAGKVVAMVTDPDNYKFRDFLDVFKESKLRNINIVHGTEYEERRPSSETLPVTEISKERLVLDKYHLDDPSSLGSIVLPVIAHELGHSLNMKYYQGIEVELQKRELPKIINDLEYVQDEELRVQIDIAKLDPEIDLRNLSMLAGRFMPGFHEIKEALTDSFAENHLAEYDAAKGTEYLADFRANMRNSDSFITKEIDTELTGVNKLCEIAYENLSKGPDLIGENVDFIKISKSIMRMRRSGHHDLADKYVSRVHNKIDELGINNKTNESTIKSTHRFGRPIFNYQQRARMKHLFGELTSTLARDLGPTELKPYHEQDVAGTNILLDGNIHNAVSKAFDLNYSINKILHNRK